MYADICSTLLQRSEPGVPIYIVFFLLKRMRHKKRQLLEHLVPGQLRGNEYCPSRDLVLIFLDLTKIKWWPHL